MASRKTRSNNHARPSTVTLKEVAEAAGVSTMTVSNVLHNRPNVGDLVRKRVLKEIKKLGYVPNRNAQELAGVAYARFGLLYTNVRNPFIASVFAGSLTAGARLRADISLQLATLDDPASLRKTIRQMVGLRWRRRSLSHSSRSPCRFRRLRSRRVLPFEGWHRFGATNGWLRSKSCQCCSTWDIPR